MSHNNNKYLNKRYPTIQYIQANAKTKTSIYRVKYALLSTIQTCKI